MKICKKEAIVIVTGAAGYVAEKLVPLLRLKYQVLGIDKKLGPYVDVESDINELDLGSYIESSQPLIIVHCAALRLDYGAKPDEYYKENVLNFSKFLSGLENLNIIQFLHISSVASIDGMKIEYNNNLSCDDAYRSTKNLQELELKKWCEIHKIPRDIFYPSAIYNNSPRADTNIGKLQSLIKYLPVLPKIPIYKSLTHRTKFCMFISSIVGAPTGKSYLTIEQPVETVSEIIVRESRSRKILIHIPLIKIQLITFSILILFLGKIFKKEPFITPSRVKKLFKDTSYKDLNKKLDFDTYSNFVELNTDEAYDTVLIR